MSTHLELTSEFKRIDPFFLIRLGSLNFHPNPEAIRFQTIIMVSDIDPSSIIALAVVLPMLDIIAVGLPFYTRSAQKTPPAMNDWLTIPAVV